MSRFNLSAFPVTAISALLLAQVPNTCLGVSVSDLSIATWSGNAQAAYSVTFDDNRDEQVNVIAPALTQRGLAATFYVNPSDELWGWNTWGAQYMALPSQGHELGGHTSIHYSASGSPPPSVFNPNTYFKTPGELVNDIAVVDAALAPAQPRGIVSFAYPWGANPTQESAPEFLEAIQNGYISARGVHTSGLGPAGFYIPNPAVGSDMYNLGCYVYTSANAATYEDATVTLTGWEDDTLAAGGWGIEYTHAIEEEGRNLQGFLEHLDRLDVHRDAGDMWVDTVGNISRYIYSRDAAMLELVSQTGNTLTLSVDDGLDDFLFDMPVTLQIPMADLGSEPDYFHIASGGQVIAHEVVEIDGIDYLQFDKLADGALVSINWLAGDINSDGGVDLNDLDIILANWQSNVTPGNLTYGDLNLDGQINLDDLDIVLANWGATSEPATYAVPEPSTLALLALGSLAIARRRQCI